MIIGKTHGKFLTLRESTQIYLEKPFESKAVSIVLKELVIYGTFHFLCIDIFLLNINTFLLTSVHIIKHVKVEKNLT